MDEHLYGAGQGEVQGEEVLSLLKIRWAQALLVHRLEGAVVGSGLNFSQWMVLMHLQDRLTPATAADLSTRLRHDSGALTRLIDQLETRRLVWRERSREDRRTVWLRLTRVGLETLRKLYPRVVEELNQALRTFSRGEISELGRLLTRLITVLESTEGHAGEWPCQAH